MKAGLSSLYLLRYNNYFNKIEKKLNTIAEYQAYQLNDSPIFNNISFNPSDGIATTQVLNWNGEDPDYVIVENQEDGTFTRWFVTKSTRLRNGQYQMDLKRDLLMDHYDDIKDEPAFIQKGAVEPSNNLIFNSEGTKYNQIKQSETLLKDASNTAWIVGYIPKDTFKDGNGAEIDKTITIKTSHIKAPNDIVVTNLTDWTYYSLLNPTTLQTTKDAFKTTYPTLMMSNGVYEPRHSKYSQFVKFSYKLYSLDINTNVKESSTYVAYDGTYVGSSCKTTATLNPYKNMSTFAGYWKPDLYGSTSPYDYVTATGWTNKVSAEETPNILKSGSSWTQCITPILGYISGQKTNIAASRAASHPTYLPSADYAALMALNGKYLYVTSSSTAYKIKVEKTTGTKTKALVVKDPIHNVNIANYYNTTLNLTGSTAILPDQIVFMSDVDNISISLEIIAETFTVTIKKPSLRRSCVDAPYDIFAIPFAEDFIIRENTTDILNSNRLALSVAEQIASAMGDTAIYDVQILPYCPVLDYIVNGKLTVTSAETTVYAPIKYSGGPNDGQTAGVLMWVPYSIFDINISYSLPVDEDNIKAMTELELYRLCSPNYASTFEFSPAKNGSITSFNVDVTLKPYSPYIHINPNFGRLYGKDFNDARGLILAGDFSLPRLTSAWANYESTNKNYKAVFDRQIQSLELQNKVGKTQDIVGAVAGTASGAASGAIAGSVAGPVGAAAGAVVGGLASAVGGAADVALNDKLRVDNLDKTKDLFNLDLANIQAQPYALTNIGALNNNNKLYPFIEYYTCSQEERIIFTNKIKYLGMTVNAVYSLEDIKSFSTEDYQFIQGRFLRLTKLEGDANKARTINEELAAGIYLEVE